MADQDPLLKVTIMTPREIVFDAPAFAVSSKNSEGSFDILPGHANFISIIQNQPIKITKPDKSTQLFNFERAIIKSAKNEVRIYADPKTIQ